MKNLKNGGGTLYTKFLAGAFYGIISGLTFVMALVNPTNIFGQNYELIYSLPEDSSLCVHTYPYLTEEVRGLFPPETDIRGKYLPLDSITNQISDILEKKWLYERDNYELIMCVIVDKEGKVRCGVILKGKKDNVACEAFGLLKKQMFVPAYSRGVPVNYWFYFSLRKEQEK